MSIFHKLCFWKKKPKGKFVQLKRTKKLIFIPHERDVGVTTIEYTSENDETFKTKVYGYFYQYYSEGVDSSIWGDVVEPSLNDLVIISSRNAAQTKLNELNCNEYVTLVDDPKNPRWSVSAKWKIAKVLYTKPYIDTVQEARLVDND